MIRSAAVLAASLAACACGAERRAADHFTVVDSAGVQVASNAESEDVVVLRPETDLAIGAVDGEPSLIFGRIADLDVDGAGNIHVLDAQASEVRVFDPAGRHVRTIGRRGEGPGELSVWVTTVVTGDDDRIYVPDPQQRRMSVFGADGMLQQTIALPPRPNGQSWARAAGGRFLVGGTAISRAADGRFTFWEGLLRARVEGSGESASAVYDTLTAFDYEPTDIGSQADIRVPVVVNTTFWAPFGDGRAAWSSLDRSEVLVVSAEGRLERILRHAAWRRRALARSDEAEFRRLLGERLTGLGGDPATADGPAVTFPDSLPAITSLLAGPRGTLWVQRMGAVHEATPEAVNATGQSRWLGGTVWDVLDSDGRAIQRVHLPAGVRPMRVRDDAIYGVALDDRAVQRVVRLRLDR